LLHVDGSGINSTCTPYFGSIQLTSAYWLCFVYLSCRKTWWLWFRVCTFSCNWCLYSVDWTHPNCQ